MGSRGSEQQPATRVVKPGDEHRGGYPAGNQPVGEIKKPPQAVTRPAKKG